MIDREKVIKGLECCTSKDGCKDCPYSQNNNGHVCAFNCISDAFALLKAQEARVLTLEEVHEMDWDYCYLEEEVIEDKVLQIYRGKYRIKCVTWPSIASCVLTFGDDAYGKRWRCWTSRPTDAQREAVKWE